MMALAAAYRVLSLYLAGLCGGRVYPDIAPAGVVKPLLVFYFIGGGNADRRRRRNETLVIGVKCISERLEDGFVVAEQVEALLHDNGTQGRNSLWMDETWEITTVTQGALMHMVELWESKVLYHTGHEYTLTMERMED